MQEQENVDLNAALIRQPLSLAILLPLLFSSSTVVILADTMHKGLNAGCISPLPPALIFYSQAVFLYSRTRFLYDCFLLYITSLEYQPGCLLSSSAPCILSSCLAVSFRECIRKGLHPWGGFFFVSLESGGNTGSFFIFYHLMCLCSRRQEKLHLLLYFCRSLFSPQCTSLYQQVKQLYLSSIFSLFG